MNSFVCNINNLSHSGILLKIFSRVKIVICRKIAKYHKTFYLLLHNLFDSHIFFQFLLILK